MPRRERPLDTEDSELGHFAADLRRLREKAGNPPYRDLAVRAHYSAAALSEAANGRKLPSLAVTLAYVEACGGDAGEWEERWRSIGSPPAPVDESPYAGLAAFQPEDADRFFGREKLTAKLLDLVGARRFTGVFGASGSGKSSLLRAGLVPRLDHAVVFTPGARPLDECAVRLASVLGESAVVLRDELTADPANLGLRIRQWNPDLVLVVDQFEEVFTLADPAAREWFVQALTSCPRVVIGVRADFYGHLGRHPELVDAVDGGQLIVGPMTTDELRRAITAPALRVGATVETALVTRLVADVTGQAAALPLVSHALVETWARRRGMTLTLAAYEEAGGLEHAVARTAEAVFGSLADEQQTVARQIFLRLIALGEGTEDTKRRVRREGLDAEVLDRLAAARLVTLDRDGVELTHEALIRGWPRLRDWIAEDRAGLLVQHRLTEAAAAWDAVGGDPDALYRGVRLAQARDLPDGSLTATERRFLEASIDLDLAREAGVRRRARRMRVLVSVLTVLVVVLTGTVVYAVRLAGESARQHDRVVAGRTVSGLADLIASDPAKAVRVALAAYTIAPGDDTRDALLNADAARRKAPVEVPRDESKVGSDFSPSGRFLTRAGEKSNWMWDNAKGRDRSELLPRQERAWARISADDKRMVVTNLDTYVAQLWDISDLDRPRQTGVLPRPFSVDAVSRSGEVVVGAGMVDWPQPPGSRATERPSLVRDSKAHIWDLHDPRQPREVVLPRENAGTPALRPDGRLLVLPLRQDHWTGETEIEFWQVDTEQPQLLNTMWVKDNLGSVMAFSQDGRFIAVRDELRKKIVVWDVADPRSPVRWAELPESSHVALLVEFGGHQVAVGADSEVQVWDVERQDAPVLLGSFGGLVEQLTALAYRPADAMFVGLDRTVSMWSFRTTVDAVRSNLCMEHDIELDEVVWESYFPDVRRRSVCP
ncbi:XRE family transcriptional regulator [Lentzea tibetensis]|uniref:XRE family transcriptional regulator n=1 Tax=Lentzea tibetensis TaxID=2591470 RepID=A0A563EVP5_9PSEU|nr:XRE family transcriptional regulator [Lentzea tibetensis]TWP51224.1 XRE family transcriptional regulator [Lentzea tibetensis]